MEDEQGQQEDDEKLGAAVVNALVFVAAMIVVTFCLVGMYYFRCIKGIVLDHDRQVDGFTSGQGGMFTPDLFATAIARLEMVTTSQDGRWTACGLAGAGPQVVQGEQTLFLFPGTYLGYQVQGTAQLDLGSHFWLTGHAMHAGTFGAWGQSAVFGQLRYGSPATLTSPSPILGSLVHGPPLTGPAQCPEPRQEVSR